MSGGAWKVAYADFVTAMMAFFLVMWLVGQDQEMKQAITRYFNNPMGFKPIGESDHPDERGHIFSSPDLGEVPASQKIALGMGRKSYSTDDEPSPPTKLVSDHMFEDEETATYWEQQARKEMKAAEKRNPDNPQAAEKAALDKIASRMRDDLISQLPEDMPEVYRDLIFEAIKDVNWQELAEDVVDDKTL